MKQRHSVLILLFFLSIITYLDRICISVAGPRMQSELDISPQLWGWVAGAFTLSYALFEIPSGALGDRIGARKVLLRIVIWWSALTALTGAVSSFAWLLVVRFLFGAGEAGAYPNSALAISRWFPKVERATAQSVVWMASRIGGAISPLVVVPIQAAYGWRASFFAFGAIGIVWAAAWYWWYRDNPSDKRGITPRELQEIESDVGAHESLPWRVALRNWNLWTIMLMYHTYAWGAYFYLSWLHTYLQRGRGMSEQEMGVYSALPFVAGACGNLVGGWTSDRMVARFGLKVGRRTVGVAGLAAAGALMLAAALTRDKWMALAFLTLGFGAMDCMLPVSWAVCLDVGRKYAGTITGAMNMAGQLGGFASSVAFGYLVAYFGNYDGPLIPLAALLLLSAVLFAFIDPTHEIVPGGHKVRTGP